MQLPTSSSDCEVPCTRSGVKGSIVLYLLVWTHVEHAQCKMLPDSGCGWCNRKTFVLDGTSIRYARCSRWHDLSDMTYSAFMHEVLSSCRGGCYDSSGRKEPIRHAQFIRWRILSGMSCSAFMHGAGLCAGGPAMIRAAAKNHESVHVVVDPSDYDATLEALSSGGDNGSDLRRQLAWKAFQHCATYDSTVAEWMWSQIGRHPDSHCTYPYSYLSFLTSFLHVVMHLFVHLLVHLDMLSSPAAVSVTLLCKVVKGWIPMWKT